jgi:hypothetical protein
VFGMLALLPHVRGLVDVDAGDCRPSNPINNRRRP